MAEEPVVASKRSRTRVAEASEGTSYMQSGDDETTEDEDASLKTCPGQVSSNSTSAGREPMKGKHDLEDIFDSIVLKEEAVPMTSQERRKPFVTQSQS